MAARRFGPMSIPSGRSHTALPCESTGISKQSLVPRYRKSMEPVGLPRPVAEAETLATKCTAWPYVDGCGEERRLTDVAALVITSPRLSASGWKKGVAAKLARIE